MKAQVRPSPSTPDGLHLHRFDADDVRRMVEAGIVAEAERVELVDGRLVAMATRGFEHDRAKDEIVRRLCRALPDDLYVAVSSTLRLSRSVLLEPDVLVARRTDVVESPEGFATVEGPRILLAIEVAASSLAYDRGRKAGLYARFGVPEYWVIDANERTAWIHSGASDDGYARVVAVPRGGVLRPAAADLAAVAIDLAALG